MTKHHKSDDKLGQLFISLDFMPFLRDDINMANLVKYEQQIFKEYQSVNWAEYQHGRIDFLSKVKREEYFPLLLRTKYLLEGLIDYVAQMSPKIAVYAGSFNPFHNGHMNVLQKAEKLFDKVIIAKGINPAKQFDNEAFERSFRELKQTLPTHEVTYYTGLITEFISKQSGEITLIRGIRNGFDLEAENNFIAYVKDINPDVKIIYIPCDKEFEHISSSAVRSLNGLIPLERYLPKCPDYSLEQFRKERK